MYIRPPQKTTHQERCKKWASLKSNAIHNTLEIAFGLIMFDFLFSSVGCFCAGTRCALSWVLTLITVVSIVLAFQTFSVSIKGYHYPENYGVDLDIDAGALYPKPQI
ncbi:hypothetical protein LY78DRAFT_653381 [Colletotrichum sublineola]|nr:hypothetical protein LY78DRAFT_653381 [Colletotrichum sublineola]